MRAIVAHNVWDDLRWYLGAAQHRPRFLSQNLAKESPFPRLVCSYCESKQENLELHEEWQYNDEMKVQILVALKPICSKCHLAKHLGYAETIGRLDEALNHLAAVNGWTLPQAKEHSDLAFYIWRKRVNTTYALDVNFLTQYIPVTKIHMNWLDNPRSWVASRLDAIMWAKELLKSDAVVLDTETTGLLEKTNVEVIELAAVDMRGKVVYERMFRTRYRIPKRVIQIHGITNEETKSCPAFPEEAEKVRAALNGRIIVTYNARFDREVIRRTFRLHKLETISAKWECAMHAYRTFSGSGPYLRLPNGSHRALSDCQATLKLIRKIARSGP